MDTATLRRSSFADLVRSLNAETRTFIREEFQLAKTELSEKASHLGRNALVLAIGGVVAYAGLLVFLFGLGYLLAWCFELAGLQPVFAGFVGLAAIGLFTMLAGGLLLLKGLQSISQESLAPERTIATLRELKGTAPQPTFTPPKPAPQVSSAELQAQVESTEERLDETLSEVGRRVSPHHINAVVKNRISSSPYRSGLVAVTAGLLSGFWLRRRFSSTS